MLRRSRQSVPISVCFFFFALFACENIRYMRNISINVIFRRDYVLRECERILALHPEYNQQVGETYRDWQYRLIIGKSQDVIGLTWNEIAEILGCSCSGETLRKNSSGICQYYEYLQAKQAEDDGTPYATKRAIDKLEAKRIEAQKEAYKVQDQRRVYRADIREQARKEVIEDSILLAIQEKDFSEPQYPIYINNNIDYNADQNKEGVLLLSDWHKGMTTTNHWNIFNDTVYQERIAKLIQKTIEYGTKEDIGILNMFVLGDMINGLIHVTTRINNQDDVIHQTIDVSQTLIHMIKTFSMIFPQVNVWFSRGNHERVTPNLKESLSPESFFDLLQFIVKIGVGENDKVVFFENDLNDEIIHANICGKTILGIHGHRDKPNTAYKNLATFLKIIPDYIFAGHLHNAAELETNGCEVILNGALCGTDDFAISLRRHSNPSQKFMIFTPEEGRLCTYNINLK